jgi:phosphatidate cytidylyltransferase
MTWKRVVTAAVLIPFVVGLVLWCSTALLALGLALVVMLAMFEYFALGDAIGQRAYRFWTASCALILIYAQWLASTMPSDYPADWELRYRYAWRFFGGPPTIPGTFFLFVLGVAVLTLFTKRPLVEALPAAGVSSSGLILVAFPLSYTVRLHGLPSQGPLLLLFALVITWAGDTAAYFVGRSIGTHALAPHLSPKKTWEGTVASFLGSLIVALVFVRWIHAPLPYLLGMAAVGNVAGQVGDLLESAYKRSAGIKDSGSLLPGHGGVLDRIDALILAVPVVWYYWIWIYSPRP